VDNSSWFWGNYSNEKDLLKYFIVTQFYDEKNNPQKPFFIVYSGSTGLSEQ
jgi:hypothetical protein